MAGMRLRVPGRLDRVRKTPGRTTIGGSRPPRLLRPSRRQGHGDWRLTMTDQARLRRDEVALKLDRLRGLLERRGQAAALRARRNVAWLTAGADTHVVRAAEDGVVTLLVTRRDVVALTAVNEAGRIREEELDDLDPEVVELPWQDPAALEAAIAARAGGPVADDRSL